MKNGTRYSRYFRSVRPNRWVYFCYVFLGYVALIKYGKYLGNIFGFVYKICIVRMLISIVRGRRSAHSPSTRNYALCMRITPSTRASQHRSAMACSTLPAGPD